ncbi:YjgB family protein [Paenibacillus sp. WLX2291]|uniref:YjgB family protein n=1 Tax=Paenibacillus sp. WLX2291 TaxID=3296934 RepID=UPI00398415D0
MKITNLISHTRKAAMIATITGVTAAGALGAASTVLPTQSVQAASNSSASEASYQRNLAIKNLNSFYKPALKGQFPGNVQEFAIGKTKRADVMKRFSSADVPRTSATGFDAYTATMGSPGYSFRYTNDVLSEIRYFGTNVERQTNIGGITMQLLRQQWYAPSSTSTITTGKQKQTKVTYNRGDYKLEFIFNTGTDLDHINLVKK